MTATLASALLPHAPPALLVGSVDFVTAERARCVSITMESWHWAEVLEGGAQSAGVLVRTRAVGVRGRCVVAAYDGVAVTRTHDAGPIVWSARHVRSVMGMHQVGIEAHGAGGAPILTAVVTLAATDAD